MLFRNTQLQYGIVAVLLHWVMAILLIGLLALGLYMQALPISLEKLKLYGWHKEYGFLALWLVLIRLGWRITSTTPYLLLPMWEKLAARTVHGLFYVLMLGLPITGWVITSAAGLPASFFGLWVLPTIVSPSEETRYLFQAIHRWLSYGLIGLIILHTSAAFKHHFVNRDDILRRMF